MLAIFPAVLALASILGLVGQARSRCRRCSTCCSPLVSEEALGTIEPAAAGARELADAPGWALSSALALALWSASGYVGAFGRAMNRIYEIGEGRPFWKLRPIMLLITLVAIVLVALVLLMLVVQRPAGRVDRRRDRAGRRGRARSGTSPSGRSWCWP